MPRRVHYRERFDQPPAGTEIDRGNPIARGLVYSFTGLPAGRDAVTGTRAVAVRSSLVRAFGATLGAASSDRIIAPLASHSAQRTYFFLAFARPGIGTFARFFDKRTSSGQVEALLFSASIQYERQTAGGNRAFPGPGLPTGVPFTLALRYDSDADPLNCRFTLNGVHTSVAGTGGSGAVVNNTDPYVLGNRANDNARAWDGWLGIFLVWDRVLSDLEVASLHANPLQVFAPTTVSRSIATAITVYRPGSDVGISGWTAVGAASRAAALADESGATYAESPDLGTPDTQTWITPFPAGPITLEVTAARTDTAGALRIVLLDAGGAAVGATAWQTLTGTPTDYVLTGAVSATSPQFRIEVQP
jgi:hypothetical protein